MKVPSLSLHVMPVHKFSALRIEGTALENQCSNLLLVGIYPEVLQRALSLKPTPPRFSAAWRVEAPFSAVSRFDGCCTLRYL